MFVGFFDGRGERGRYKEPLFYQTNQQVSDNRRIAAAFDRVLLEIAIRIG